MDIVLYTNSSEPNKLNKTLSNAMNFSGTLREETSILTPSIMLEMETPIDFNYAYIPQFKRYYYITNITSIRNNLWRLNMKCDVLQSYQEGIKNLPVILDHTQDTQKEMYLSDNVWKNIVKEKTDIVTFPNGLNENGEFILITAGG